MAQVLSTLNEDFLVISKIVSEVTDQSRAALTQHQILQLQNIDRMSQSLQDLVAVCDLLATGPHSRASSKVHLQLAETRSILDSNQENDQSGPAGSVEIF
ncbi:hypothetical protein [Tateyamaria omphalii]|uniref:hypothetical protein n=1 Tax=Tateyamaria omphalii TaxID=299262 RepID=UPI001E3D3803|nr:hypothetical protein [Tateyamaria omphalii]